MAKSPSKAPGKPGKDPRRKPNRKARGKGAAAPTRGGRTAGPPADAWVLRCAPGLARTLQSELRHDQLVGRGERVDLLWQRNHDLVFLPALPRPPKPHELRIAEELHRCLIYGRFKVSDSQLDRLAGALKGQRRRLVVTADGRHFNRFDLARFLARELGRRGVRIDDAATQPLFVFCIEQAFYACVPHRTADQVGGREARRAEREGSLPPTIAAAMAFLARPGERDTVVDPVCGSGTLLAEAAAYAPGAELHGVDTDPQAVKTARRNLAGVPQAQIAEGDGRALDLRPGSVTLALANLPFGKQFGDAVENRELYSEILAGLRKLAAPQGFRAAIIAADAELLESAAEEAGFRADLKVPVKVRGEAATILLLTPAASRSPA